MSQPVQRWRALAYTRERGPPSDLVDTFLAVNSHENPLTHPNRGTSMTRSSGGSGRVPGPSWAHVVEESPCAYFRARTSECSGRLALALLIGLFGLLGGLPALAAGQATTVTVAARSAINREASFPASPSLSADRHECHADGDHRRTGCLPRHQSSDRQLRSHGGAQRLQQGTCGPGITLPLNQDAVVDVTLATGGVTETVEVRADAPLLNTTTRRSRRAVRRGAHLRAAGDEQPRHLQRWRSRRRASVSWAAARPCSPPATNFSSNGMRVRSNNFMIDGQDSNDPSVTGRQQPLNNTDIIQEVRLITNQFAAEFGRAAGSVVNVITKSGTNNFRGSGFIFHNNNKLNARSNLDKTRGPRRAPFREETNSAAPSAGPILRDRTFFFGSFQRWTDGGSAPASR